jgi:hypothetical protein
MAPEPSDALHSLALAATRPGAALRRGPAPHGVGYNGPHVATSASEWVDVATSASEWVDVAASASEWTSALDRGYRAERGRVAH